MRNSHPLALVAVFVGPVLAAALSFGQVIATTQPGVAPPALAAGVAIAPASDARIAVLPFAPTNPQAGTGWIGKSIQQSLSADLLQAAPGRVQTADAVANASADAAAAGRQLGANYAIFGTYTSADNSVRIIGQVVDCSTGNAITALKVTGKLGDVFVLEDDLSHQARTALFGASAAPAGPAYTVHDVPDNSASANSQTYYPPNGAAAVPQSSTGYAYPPPSGADQQYQQTYVSQPSSVYYSYPAYSYSYYSYPYYSYYSYPYYGWGYPYIGIGFGFGYGGHYYGGYHGGWGGGYHGGGFHGGGGGGHR